MFNEGFLKIVAIITGVLVAGEALALLVGMVVLSPHPNPWISPWNIFWFGLDIVLRKPEGSIQFRWSDGGPDHVTSEDIGPVIEANLFLQFVFL